MILHRKKYFETLYDNNCVWYGFDIGRKSVKKKTAIPIVNYKCIVWDPDIKASSSKYEKSMDKI